MSYLLQTDLTTIVRNARLQDLLDDDEFTPEEVFEMAVADTLSIIGDSLSRYDMEAELALVGTERNRTVIFHAKNICVYIIYNRADDNDVPELIIKNYDDSLKSLQLISSGKMNINLPLISDDTDGDGEADEPKTKFRHGGEKPRIY